MRGLGTRFLIVGLLALAMFIPLFFVALVIDDRSRLSENTLREVGNEWGGAQLLSGPVLIVPVEGPVTVTRNIDVTDPETGAVTQETEQVVEIRGRQPLYLLPRDFHAEIDAAIEIRSRGLFDVPVYQANTAIRFDFDTETGAQIVPEGDTILWDQAMLQITLSDNRALRGDTTLTNEAGALALEPRQDGTPGIIAATGDPRGAAYDLVLNLNGAATLQTVPMGRNSTITIASDWPDPSFQGAFLPDSRNVTETGFTASWQIPHLARPLAQASRENPDLTARNQSAFGVAFLDPNDFYQKAYRAARYGILFIALTFLTVLLIEGRTKRPTHPVQYILIGLAQSIFVLLMVSYAEQIGFGAAYALSSGATIALLTLFGAFALKLGLRTIVLALALGVTYGILYLILQSTDYALLAGSTLAFMALALTMYMTRNEDWYGPPRDPSKTIFGTPKVGAAQVPPPPPPASPPSALETPPPPPQPQS